MASLSSITGTAIISYKDGGVKLEKNVKTKPYNHVLSLSYPGKRNGQEDSARWKSEESRTDRAKEHGSVGKGLRKRSG